MTLKEKTKPAITTRGAADSDLPLAHAGGSRDEVDTPICSSTACRSSTRCRNQLECEECLSMTVKESCTALKEKEKADDRQQTTRHRNQLATTNERVAHKATEGGDIQRAARQRQERRATTKQCAMTTCKTGPDP